MTRPAWSRSPTVATVAAALGGVLLLALTAFFVDARVAALAAHWRSRVLDIPVSLLNPIGAGVTLLLVCLALAVACRAFRLSRLHHAASLAVLAFASAGIVEFALKHLIGRPRPDAALPVLGALGPSFVRDVDSFPSGHATSVFAVATVFAACYPRLRWPLYVLAAAIALGRVYLDRHYVSDILAGAAIGFLVASSVLRHGISVAGWASARSAADSSR